MELYPVHLQLKQRTALVVGGGPVAAVKAQALLKGGARLRVVAQELSDEMRRLAEEHRLPVERRRFAPSDLDGVWLVVFAEGKSEVRRTALEAARRRSILVCVVDDPAGSDFIAPAVLRRGDLLVTVSTSGVAPALASRIRDYLGEILGEAYGRVLEDLKAVRHRLKKEIPDMVARRRAWYELVDKRVLPALRRGEMPESLSPHSTEEET